MQITGVGSRRVIQLGACVAIVFGLIGKVGGLFASMPRDLPPPLLLLPTPSPTWPYGF